MTVEYDLGYKIKLYKNVIKILKLLFSLKKKSTTNKFVAGATKPRAAPEKIALPYNIYCVSLVFSLQNGLCLRDAITTIPS